MNRNLISSFFFSLILALFANFGGGAVNAETEQTRASFGECVQEPVTPPAPTQLFQLPPMPNPAPQVPGTDTLPNRPGGPGWNPGGNGGGGGSVDETVVRIFSMESQKGLCKEMRKAFNKQIPFKSFKFVKESDKGGSVFKDESALLFPSSRYDVAKEELPAILMKDSTGKHIFSVSNYKLTKEALIQDVEKAYGVKATEK
jgi:hypothetical protein